MERGTTAEIAREIMGDNLLDPIRLSPFLLRLGLSIGQEPDIPYTAEELSKYADTHLLVLGVPVTIMRMREVFGLDPLKSEPCFYNQDWYLGQKFIDISLPAEWFLIQKEVSEDTRAVQPASIMQRGMHLPSAVQCTYTFFANYFAKAGEKLWEYDFVWCSDVDHNGDRIYVGKYTDIDGMNKPGFSIHRHLALRPCYGAVSCL